MSREIREDRRSRLIDEVGQAAREYGTANDAVDQAAAERLGINRTDIAVLDILDQAGGKTTAGALAEASHLTTGAITAVVDRLQKKGYVRRARDKEDRRRVLVELTEKVRKKTMELYGPIAEAGYRNLEEYTDEQLEFIRDVMRRATNLLIEQAGRIRGWRERPS
ncbi:MAG: MarR family transcriptional regulator [Actinomycetota bacterium]